MKSILRVVFDYYHKQHLQTSLRVRIQYLIRIFIGRNTRDENIGNHFCVYFLPYNLENKEVFLVHHKKSNLWLFPGGHVDREETPSQTLKREMYEELGVILVFWRDFLPFLLTITKIPKRKNTKCKKHFDIWYRVQTDGLSFNVDMSEFLETRWLSLDQARKLVTDRSNIMALDSMQTFFDKVL